MKAVLLSVRPQWCEKICHQIGTENGKPVYEKALEIRKNKPKIPTPFKCYIYCTKGNLTFWDSHALMAPYRYVDDHSHNMSDKPLNGQVIGEFVCDSIEDIECSSDAHSRYSKPSCLSQDDFIQYCNGQDLYGWHISDLQIYDKPRELREFKQCDKCPYGDRARCDEHEFSCDGTYALNRPPQSWCYIEEVQP